jgi:hypothetical protein
MTDNANEPAFPLDATEWIQGEKGKMPCYGITKREYFAAKAMEGMNANPELMEVITSQSIKDGTAFQKMARKSFEIADAMLAHQETKITTIELLNVSTDLNGVKFSEEAIKSMQDNPPKVTFDHSDDTLRLNGEEVEFAPQMIGDQFVSVSIIPKSKSVRIGGE